MTFERTITGSRLCGPIVVAMLAVAFFGSTPGCWRGGAPPPGVSDATRRTTEAAPPEASAFRNVVQGQYPTPWLTLDDSIRARDERLRRVCAAARGPRTKDVRLIVIDGFEFVRFEPEHSTVVAHVIEGAQDALLDRALQQAGSVPVPSRLWRTMGPKVGVVAAAVPKFRAWSHPNMVVLGFFDGRAWAWRTFDNVDVDTGQGWNGDDELRWVLAALSRYVFDRPDVLSERWSGGKFLLDVLDVLGQPEEP